LFKLYKVKESDLIKEAEFSQMSTMILYSLLPVRSPRPLAKKVDVYQELMKIYSTKAICEQILDQILNDVNQTIGNRLEKHEVIIRLLRTDATFSFIQQSQQTATLRLYQDICMGVLLVHSKLKGANSAPWGRFSLLIG
jgi:hypothetical protein